MLRGLGISCEAPTGDAIHRAPQPAWTHGQPLPNATSLVSYLSGCAGLVVHSGLGSNAIAVTPQPL